MDGLPGREFPAAAGATGTAQGGGAVGYRVAVADTLGDAANLMLERESLRSLAAALEKLDGGFASMPDFSPKSPGEERLAEVLEEVAERLQNNFPYFHPMYAGQMLKPPHPLARMAYALAMWINPNNHALDGGRASSAMEKEAVAQIAKMFGWENPLAHLCGGGTTAHLEALWGG